MKRIITILVALLCVGSLSAQEYDYENLPSHPRLHWQAGQEEAVQTLIATHPEMEGIHKRILNYCDFALSEPTSVRIKTGKRLLDVSRRVLKRTLYLSYAYRMTGNEAYARRAEQEMLAACTFSDWNPSHFLDVGEMAFGLAIGYDWLYDVLSEESRATIRQGLIDKALNVALTPQAKFYRSKTNWNQVCNGGLVCAALAIAEDEPALAKTIVDKALATIGLALTNYAPDGAYPEGFQYWTYGTSYQVLLNDALETVFGHSNGLSDADGLLRSARFVQFMTAPSGDCFNFSDANPQAYSNIMMPWFAYKTNDPSLMWLEMSYLKDADTDFGEYNEERHLPCLLIFASRVDLSNIKPPKEYVWSSDGINPLFIYRSGWQSANDIYLGIKGGLASFSHAHMDAGSFVYENEGVRWAMDLGMQAYYSLEKEGVDLWNMTQNSQRWDVYRIGPDAHNTLTIDGSNHNVDGKAEITRTWNSRHKKGAEVDLGAVLGDAVGSAQRSVVLHGKRTLVVTDRLVGGKENQTIRWTMCTPAEAVISGPNSFLLRSQGKSMEVKVDAPVEVKLHVWDNLSPNSFDYANPNTLRIAFDYVVPAGEAVDVKVTLKLK